MNAESWQKEQFSNAFMLAPATNGGYTLGEWNVDKDGVDLTIRSRGLMVDFQLKCTQRPRLNKDDYAFDLDVKTYDKLRDPDRSAPSYLALVIVPEKLDDWIIHQPDKMLMSCHGFWSKFEESAARPNKATVAVKLPRQQRLNVLALEEMFKDSLNRVRYGTQGGEAA